jgi:hypothetical protein
MNFPLITQAFAIDSAANVKLRASAWTSDTALYLGA